MLIILGLSCTGVQPTKLTFNFTYPKAVKPEDRNYKIEFNVDVGQMKKNPDLEGFCKKFLSKVQKNQKEFSINMSEKGLKKLSEKLPRQVVKKFFAGVMEAHFHHQNFLTQKIVDPENEDKYYDLYQKHIRNFFKKMTHNIHIRNFFPFLFTITNYLQNKKLNPVILQAFTEVQNLQKVQTILEQTGINQGLRMEIEKLVLRHPLERLNDIQGGIPFSFETLLKEKKDALDQMVHAMGDMLHINMHMGLKLSDLNGLTEYVKKKYGNVHLKKIKHVDFMTQAVSDMSELRNFPNIEHLMGNNNRVTDASFLAKLEQLEQANLFHNRISKVPSLENLKKLDNINLDNNQIEKIPTLPDQLRGLNLSYNKITDASSLKKLKELSWLTLKGNMITDFSFLNNLKKLTILEIADNPINEKFWNMLPAIIAKLNDFSINGNVISRHAGIRDAITNNPNLHNLRIYTTRKYMPERIGLFIRQNIHFIDENGSNVPIQITDSRLPDDAPEKFYIYYWKQP